MKIAVIGCGTTGTHILPLLKETLLVIDRDIVEERNLERQPLYTKEDIGKPKALVIGKKLECDYTIMDLDFTSIDALKNVDLIIDCTDNLATRFLINEYCKKNNKLWIYTGVVGNRGRVMAVTGDFCFRCLFSEVKGLDTCSTIGVDLSVAQHVAEVAVEEAERVLRGEKSRGLWANGEWVAVKKRNDCDVCNGDYSYLDGKQDTVVKFCGSSRYQFKGTFDFENVKKRLGGKGDWFVHDDFYIFKDRVLVKAENETEAKKKFTEIIGF